MEMRTSTCVQRAVTILFASITFLAAMWATADEPEPWTLRDHYTFKGPEASLSFDVKTAEWKIDVSGLGSLAGNVRSEVDIDGDTIVVSSLIKAKDERESFSSPIGDGTFYRSVFESKGGVVIRYAITRLNEQAFMIMRMSVENVSGLPVEISSIRPAVLEGGYLAEYGDIVKPTTEQTGHRGGFALVEQSEMLSLVRFDLKGSPATIGVGVLRSGDMESGLSLTRQGEHWIGRIDCRFAPTLRLGPGETVEADPVWISFFGDDPAAVRQMHGFAQAKLFPADTPAEVPASWAAVDKNSTLEDLYLIAGTWSKSGLRHVLVDESIDGTPINDVKALGKINKKLESIGLVAGVQIDPFANLAESAETPTVAAARRHIKARLKKLVDKGFAFFVLPETRMSDEDLRSMSLTREQANAAALAFVTQAADGLPVMPAPTLLLAPDPARWREATSTTSPYEAYGMRTGPVRFSVDALKSISAELQTAIEAFPGSIELLGKPRKKVAQALNEVIVAGGASNNWN